MNQKLKQAGLFVILAVFTLSLTTSFVGNAEASPIDRGLTFEIPEPSVKAQQKANVEVEVRPEFPTTNQIKTKLFF